MTEFKSKHEQVPNESKEISENLRLLHELEATGEYVFHGSSVSDVAELEPRQPKNKKDGVMQNHGEPSVVATPYADIAIFRSIVFMDSTGFGVGEDGPEFRSSQTALDAARYVTGYVYVLPKSNFKPLEGNEEEMDWRADTSQTPSQIIEVSFKDLPEGIKIIQSEK